MHDNDDWWFPRRSGGGGWDLPYSWQGWLVLIAYAVVVGVILRVHRFLGDTGAFFALLGATGALILIAWIKGEPPRRDGL